MAFFSLISFNAWMMDQKVRLTIPRPRKFYSTVAKILEEFVMKRGNPPHQVESFCPRCPLNANCYTNSSKYYGSQNNSSTEWLPKV